VTSITKSKNKMKKNILIVGWSLGENSFGVTKPYLDYFTGFGNPRILLPSDDVLEGDLLVLPGGADMAPQSYGQAPSYYAGMVDPYKQYFYDTMLPKYIESGIPVFGICLGFQQLCVFFGSELEQHLDAHPYSNISRDEKAHDIFLSKDGQRYFNPTQTDADKKKGVHRMGVNSLHHQAAPESLLSKELNVLAVAATADLVNDKIVEAVKHRTLPVAGVQWHPEEYRDRFSSRLISELLTSRKTISQPVVKTPMM
jgi:gamma-glutamyl-gamma-aminobutyrate hydrolase PuuD